MYLGVLKCKCKKKNKCEKCAWPGPEVCASTEGMCPDQRYENFQHLKTVKRGCQKNFKPLKPSIARRAVYNQLHNFKSYLFDCVEICKESKIRFSWSFSSFPQRGNETEVERSEIFHSKTLFPLFLDATTHLYKRLCPSVGSSDGPSDVCDGRTDGRTDTASYRDARTHLKRGGKRERKT